MAVPLIIVAFEVQPIMVRWKGLRLKMAKNRRMKQMVVGNPEDDGMPDFLKHKGRTSI